MQKHEIGPVTERLVLRALTVEDAPDFFALNSNLDVMRYTGEPPLESLDEARDAIANYPDFETVGYGRWACVLKAEQRVIGFCGLKYLDDLKETDVGYRFLPEYWGKGLATEACQASVDFGFDVLRLNRIIGLILPDNIASQRVLEKVGMRYERSIVYEGDQAIVYSKSMQPSR